MLTVERTDSYFCADAQRLGFQVPKKIRMHLFQLAQQRLLKDLEEKLRDAKKGEDAAKSRLEKTVADARAQIQEEITEFEVHCELIVDDWDVSAEEKGEAAKHLLGLQKKQRRFERNLAAFSQPLEEALREATKKRELIEVRVQRQRYRCRTPMFDRVSLIATQDEQDAAAKGSPTRIRPTKPTERVPLEDYVVGTKEEVDDWKDHQRPSRMNELRLLAKRRAMELGDAQELQRLDQGGNPKITDDVDELTRLKADLRTVIDRVPLVHFELFKDLMLLAKNSQFL